jgi:hypothetical protein
MAYFLLGKNWPAFALVTMWWDVAATQVRRGTEGADGARPDVEGAGDVDTFLAGVGGEAGNGVATTPADGDVEVGVETTVGVETGVGNGDDTMTGVDAGGEPGVDGVMEAG